MSILHEQPRPASRRLVIGGAVATLIVHGGILASVLAGRAGAAVVAQPQVGRSIEVQAVKFGHRDTSAFIHKPPPSAHKAPTLQLSSSDHAREPEKKQEQDIKKAL